MTIIEAITVLSALPVWFDRVDRPSSEEAMFREAQHVVDSEKLYRGISPQEGQWMARCALELFDAGFHFPLRCEGFEDIPDSILTHLADVVPGALRGIHPEILKRGFDWFQMSLFREADANVRDQIVNLLEATNINEQTRSKLLFALAWIGDLTVQTLFHKWNERPPIWRTSLSNPSEYFPFEYFPLQAGWELTKDGTRRDLYYQPCYDVVRLAATEEMPAPGGWILGTLQDDVCGWCGRQLTPLFDLDRQDNRLSFLLGEGERLRIPVCLNCDLQCGFNEERLFMDVDEHGLARWSPISGERPDRVEIITEGQSEYVAPFSLQPCQLGDARPTPYERSLTHIGGCPEWAQYDDYPHCPICQQTMIFVGQYDLDEVEFVGPQYLEGFLYAFWCRKCGKSTTGQQH